MTKEREIFRLTADVLIIGGGTAGCLAAVEARERDPEATVIILEKANIDRSGCLAAGMNAINAYLNPGETPESFVKYVRYDACGLIREDLVLSGAEELNSVVRRVEEWGLPIKKDEKGNYQPRGRWNIKINGESLKPIIAAAARKAGARVINRVVATNFLLEDGRVVGAVGFGVRDGKIYAVRAGATIVATGGAAGIYKPNNPGSAHHKMWYSPFNTGAGYAMGIRAGAEMTSFEMRFIALRTKDVISPTGTLALGFGAPQVNSRGEKFMSLRYGHLGGEGAPTPLRVYGPTKEVKEGRGPCYMDTRHLSSEQVHDLKAAFLDMYPGIVLYWAANEIDPSREPIEISGTEPYVMGGHCQAGYWIDVDRSTTLPGLFAAGDVAGGYPYKFVSGCWAEGAIAARAAVKYARERRANVSAGREAGRVGLEDATSAEASRIYAPLDRSRAGEDGVAAAEMEERLQKIMDEYAGGVGTFYEMNDARLEVALKKVRQLRCQFQYLLAADFHELMLCHEVIDRVEIAEAVVLHLLHRKETRWPGYQTRLDYPERDDFKWLKFINSKRNPETGDIEIVERPYKQMVSGDRYLPR
ncbi:MAG: adenylyl-sulfate reductase subunit alpha [Actinobacteria bacterium]|nr:adenylyl-sulfate reductase subunit alpha [Actinomycetota bacterium]